MCIRKTRANVDPDFFQCEQRNLALLAAHNIQTPKVINLNQQQLILEYIAHHSIDGNTWKTLGQMLANLHRNTTKSYGLHYNNYFSYLKQDNRWCDNWCQFYIEQRLRPLLTHPLLDEKIIKQFELVFDKMPTIIDNTEPPALLHGDLWENNVLYSDKGIYFIDPACYYGSREIELAYLEFTGFAHPKFIASYHQAYPIDKAYQQRKPFYLLYPYLTLLHVLGKNYLAGLRCLLSQLISTRFL